MRRLLLAAAIGAAALMAQDDPPSRVARLNWISGDVSFRPATMDTWTNAAINYPVTGGDHIFAGSGARAELHIGPNVIRLNSNTNFGFLNLNDAGIQMTLNQGSLEIRLRQLDQNDAVEVDTPNGAFSLLRAGDYRIDSDPDRNATTVTVRSGQGEMYQDGNSLLVSAHQTVWFRDGASPDVRNERQRDDFDAFTTSRNNAEDNLPRRDYVPESMVGYQDLYAYGSWQNEPDYGWAWAPPVSAGWAPYSTGRWAYVDPWGWTWIDDAPWGFAPFHYGRWAFARNRWLWVPGAREYRPVYSPALVVFVGGSGFSASVGWFPLGPREPWIPSWRASDGYIRRANSMNVTNINVTNIHVTNVNYVNRGNPAAITAVSRGEFAGARPVRGSAVHLSADQVRGGQIMGSAPQIAPARNSVLLNQERPRPALSNRQVIARTPPPPAPVSFDARRQALDQNQGRPLDRNQVEQLRRQQPAAVVSPPTPVRAISSAQQPQRQLPQQPMPQQKNVQRGGDIAPQVTRPDDTRQQNRMTPLTQPRPTGQPQPRPAEPSGQSTPVPAPQPRPERPNQRPVRQQTVPQNQPERQPPVAATPQASPQNQPHPDRPNQRQGQDQPPAPQQQAAPPNQPGRQRPETPRTQPSPQAPPASQPRPENPRQAEPQSQPQTQRVQPAHPAPEPRLERPVQSAAQAPHDRPDPKSEKEKDKKSE